MENYYNHHCTIHAGTLGEALNYILNPMNVIYRNNGVVFSFVILKPAVFFEQFL